MPVNGLYGIDFVLFALIDEDVDDDLLDIDHGDLV